LSSDIGKRILMLGAERWQIQPLRPDIPALRALSDAGMSHPSDEQRRALALGLTHVSYLHEHQGELPGLTPNVLRALDAVGGSVQ
jgi:hypothetical protein